MIIKIIKKYYLKCLLGITTFFTPRFIMSLGVLMIFIGTIIMVIDEIEFFHNIFSKMPKWRKINSAYLKLRTLSYKLNDGQVVGILSNEDEGFDEIVQIIEINDNSFRNKRIAYILINKIGSHADVEIKVVHVIEYNSIKGKSITYEFIFREWLNTYRRKYFLKLSLIIITIGFIIDLLGKIIPRNVFDNIRKTKIFYFIKKLLLNFKLIWIKYIKNGFFKKNYIRKFYGIKYLEELKKNSNSKGISHYLVGNSESSKILQKEVNKYFEMSYRRNLVSKDLKKRLSSSKWDVFFQCLQELRCAYFFEQILKLEIRFPQKEGKIVELLPLHQQDMIYMLKLSLLFVKQNKEEVGTIIQM